MNGLYSAFNEVLNLMNYEQPSISADLIDKLIKNKSISNLVTYDFLSRNTEKDGGNFSYDNVICFFLGGGSLGEYEYIYDLLNQNNYNIYNGSNYIYLPIEIFQYFEELGKVNANSFNY
jgi:hypothetical protein